MNRREFLVGSALAASAPAPSAQNAGSGAMRITIYPDQPIASIAPDFMGLGYEISSVGRPGLLSPENKTYIRFVRTLRARGVIRIGGNTSDYASYSAEGQPVSKAFDTVVNDAVLKDLGGFLRETGWRLVWGLNLGRGQEANAIEEAKAVWSFARDNLLAFEIGNEPDLFGRAKHRNADYGYADWLAEYRRLKSSLRAAIPSAPLAGPDVAGKTDWVTRFAADEGNDIALLTHHYYREGQNATSTIQKLLGDDPKLKPQLTQLSAASKACGIPFRICEVNSFSGGGRPAVSDSMARALWVLDYMFSVASNGGSGVNMETGVNQLDFISSYSPIGDDEQGHYSAKPEYYGMLAFSLAGRGRLLKTEMDGESPEIKVYATGTSDGKAILTVINKGTRMARVNANVASGAVFGKASIIRLSGPALDAKTGVTLGGSKVTPEGVWNMVRAESARPGKRALVIETPEASAAIVEFE